MTAHDAHRARMKGDPRGFVDLDRVKVRDLVHGPDRAAREPGSQWSESEPRPTLTVAETADLLGVSSWLVQQQVARGVLPCVRLGRRILISRSRLLAWLDNEP